MGDTQMYGAYGHSISLTKCAFFVLCRYRDVCPPVCLDTSICLDAPCVFGYPLYVWTPPYAQMHLYVWRLPHMFGCPIWYDTPNMFGHPPYVWMSPVCLDDKACFLCVVCSTALFRCWIPPHMFGCPYVLMAKHTFFVLCVTLLTKLLC